MIGEEGMRQLTLKLQEALSRETVALRADNADLRTSLADALRLVAEERKERQNEITDATRRLKELQNSAEELMQRLEGLARSVQMQAGDNRTSFQELEQLVQMTELRTLAAVQEEGRARDQALQREQQGREAMCGEMEQRWRTLLNEERILRNKEMDSLSQQLGRFEATVRADREAQTQKNNELSARLDD